MSKFSEKDHQKILEELRNRVLEQDKNLKEKKEYEEIAKANKEALKEMTELPPEEIDRIEKSIEAEFEAKLKRKRKYLIWMFSVISLVAIIVLLVFISGNNGKTNTGDEPESDQKTENGISEAEVQKNWIFDTRYWVQDGDGIQYGEKVADAVAWVDKKIENNATITFDWISDSEDDYKIELLCILFGNGALKGNFWKDGIVLNYTVMSEELHVSWIRLNGIYADVVTVNEERDLPYFGPNKTHNCKIEYKDNLLSFFIDDKPIQLNVLTEIENTSGYFGIAHYWEFKKDKVKVSNVRVQSE